MQSITEYLRLSEEEKCIYDRECILDRKRTDVEGEYLVKCCYESDIRANHLRGLIYRDKRVLSMTYPVPLEVRDMDDNEQVSLLSELGTKLYRVEELIDGTLLRMSHIDGVWLLSTNGKKDAKTAFWMNGCSFYDQFWSCDPQINYDSMNPNYVYLFLLCHPLNVIVVNHQHPTLYHVATYDRETFREVPFTQGAELDPPMQHPRVLNMTVDEVYQKIQESRAKPVDSAGYMVIVNDGEVVHRYRFENYNYSQARDLRGDSNNIHYHILSLMLDRDPQKLSDFLEYYPIYRSDMILLSKRLSSLIAKFYREYGQRFKEHSPILVHRRHHRFLNELHTQLYLGSLRGQGKTVQYQDINDYVRSQPVARVLYLLNYIYDVDGGHAPQAPQVPPS